MARTIANQTPADSLEADCYEIADIIGFEGGVEAVVVTPFGHLRVTSAGNARSIAAPVNTIHGYGATMLTPTPQGVFATAEDGLRSLSDGPAHSLRGYTGRIGDPHRCAALGAVLVAAEDEAQQQPAALLAIGEHGVSELWRGEGFVSRPVTSERGDIAFLTWRDPSMPWDQTELLRGVVTSESIRDLTRVPAPAGANAQPSFGPDGALYFLNDSTGYFELWRDDGVATAPVTSIGADIGLSLGKQSSRSYAFRWPSSCCAVVWREGRSHLITLDLNSGAYREIATSNPPADLLTSCGDAFYFADLPREGPVSLRRLDRTGEHTVWTAPTAPAPLGAAPLTLTASTADGAEVKAFHFPAASADRKRLVILNLHGGPKSLTPPRLKGPLRMLRDDGYDIVELNYRGSAGHGRVFRDRINSAWGLADTADVLAIAATLERRGIATHADIVLRGASAGAFTALNALAASGQFAGAISYYAATDLTQLARTTHRFERHYVETLLGEADPAHEVYRTRSPIHRAEHMTAPILLLQGEADTVTPPAQSTAFAARVREAGGRCALHLFEDEGHGFKKLETLRRCLELERAFLRGLA